MKKKVLKMAAVFCTVCMLAAVFAGCSGTETPAPSASPAGDEAKDDVIVMGTNAEFPPFEYVTSENPLVDKYDGIDVAIALEIGKALGKEVKIENMEFDSLLVALATGKVDFVAAGMTVEPDRQKNADFSDTYYLAKQVIIAKEGTGIKSAEDLRGKAVGVVLGYTGDTTMTKNYPEANLTRFKKGADAVMELTNGKIDAVVIDAAPAKAFVAKNAGLTIIEDAEAFENEEYAIAVKKGNTQLLEKINETLKTLKSNGTIDQLGQKYSE